MAISAADIEGFCFIRESIFSELVSELFVLVSELFAPLSELFSEHYAALNFVVLVSSLIMCFIFTGLAL